MQVLFETPRLRVRRITLNDVDALLPILGDAESTRYYKSGKAWSRADVEQFLAGYPFGDNRIVSEPGIALLKPTEAIIGYGGVGYLLREGNTADLMFILRSQYWGRGLATEMAKAAVATAFRRPEVSTIHATVHPDNRASIQVLEKSGLRPDGYLAELDRLLYRIDRDQQ